MEDLLDEVPQARKFLDGVRNNVAKYELFEGESFMWVVAGVLATSAPDAHCDAFEPEALNHMAQQINCDVMWLRFQHNPLIQPLGRVIASRVFYSPKSSLHFLFGVSGVYDPERLRRFSDYGIEAATLEPEAGSLERFEATEPRVTIAFSPQELADELVETIIADSPPMVSKTPEIRFRKAKEPMAIFTLATTIWLIAFNPFSKAFLERVGQKAADQCIAFLSWVRNKLIAKLAQLRNRPVLLIFETTYAGCKIELVVDSNNQQFLVEATNSLNVGVRSAMSVVQRLQELEVDSIVYHFDAGARQWLPLHATTKRAGVISNRAQQIPMDQLGGFSVGGVVLSVRRAVEEG